MVYIEDYTNDRIAYINLFQTLLDKRSAVENFRKMSNQSALSNQTAMPSRQWRAAPHRPEPFLAAHLARRPSSRGSESSYESTSPTSYPGLVLHSPASLTTPDKIYQNLSPGGGDPLAAAYPAHFTFRGEHKPAAGKVLRKEVSRPKPYYSSAEQASSSKENNHGAGNKMRQGENAKLRQGDTAVRHLGDTRQPEPQRSPPGYIPASSPLRDMKQEKVSREALAQLQSESAVAAGRIAVARCAGFNSAIDLGRYITVVMDTSYKLASLAIFLYHNATARQIPRQVAVRTIQ